MQKNVDTFEALLRITGGLAGLAWSTATMVRHPEKVFPVLMSVVCALNVAEGITRFCPMRQLISQVRPGLKRLREQSFEERPSPHDYYAEYSS